MAIFLLFATFLFACGLMNSYFFLVPPSKLSSWLCSLLQAPTSPSSSSSSLKPGEKAVEEEKKEVEGSLSSTVENADLESIFATFDNDGDGYITMDELEESLQRLGISVTSNEVISMMKSVDGNGDGLMDLAEFHELYAMIGRRSSHWEEDNIGKEEEDDDDEEMDLKEAFHVFDGNGDGLIAAEELGFVLASLGLKQRAKAEDLKEMIRKVDLDGDGMVNFDEFKKMMMVNGRKLF